MFSVQRAVKVFSPLFCLFGVISPKFGTADDVVKLVQNRANVLQLGRLHVQRFFSIGDEKFFQLKKNFARDPHPLESEELSMEEAVAATLEDSGVIFRTDTRLRKIRLCSGAGLFVSQINDEFKAQRYIDADPSFRFARVISSFPREKFMSSELDCISK